MEGVGVVVEDRLQRRFDSGVTPRQWAIDETIVLCRFQGWAISCSGLRLEGVLSLVCKDRPDVEDSSPPSWKNSRMEEWQDTEKNKKGFSACLLGRPEESIRQSVLKAPYAVHKKAYDSASLFFCFWLELSFTPG